MAQRVYFSLSISADRYLEYYRGSARNVVTTSTDGRRVAFPADRLRPFITREGIYGVFMLEFDDNNRFVAMKRVADLPRH